jgi:hypothetical protein
MPISKEEGGHLARVSRSKKTRPRKDSITRMLSRTHRPGKWSIQNPSDRLTTAAAASALLSFAGTHTLVAMLPENEAPSDGPSAPR